MRVKKKREGGGGGLIIEAQRVEDRGKYREMRISQRSRTGEKLIILTPENLHP